MLEIILFQAEPEATLEGRPVRLTWRVEGALWVSIDRGVGEVDEAGRCEVFPAASGLYTLTAGSPEGDRLSETVHVRVSPMPLIRTLFVPAPRLSHTVVLRGVEVAAPSIRLAAPTIRLSAPSFHVPLKVDLSVRFAAESARAAPGPTSADRAAGPALGRMSADRIPRVGDVFDQIRKRVKSEVNTRTGDQG